MITAPAAPFEVAVATEADEVELVACGELDLVTAPTLADAISSLERLQPPRVLIDFTGITFIDVAGLRVLLDAARRARARGGELVLRRPSPPISRILRITALDQSISIAPAA